MFIPSGRICFQIVIYIMKFCSIRIIFSFITIIAEKIMHAFQKFIKIIVAGTVFLK